MILSEVVEEITEKAPTYLSVPSIIRKITQVRDRILRNATSAQQQSETVVYECDLLEGKGTYPLTFPQSSIVDVLVDYSGDEGWTRIPYRQFDEYYRRPYYYFLNKTIGVVPTPKLTVLKGIKIFYTQSLPELTINDMDSQTGFDPNFDMLLVYGVLVDIGKKEYKEDYDTWLYEYKQANSGWERYVVKERW